MSEEPDAYSLEPHDSERPAGTEGGASAMNQALPAGFVPPVVVVVEEADPDEEEIAARDAAAHKGVAMAGYFVFVIPLLFAPNSRFARYHANQGLLIFIPLAALFFVQSFIGCIYTFGPTIPALQTSLWILGLLWALVRLVWIVGIVALWIVGCGHVGNGLMEPLPVVGGNTLIRTSPEPEPEEVGVDGAEKQEPAV